MLCIQYGNEAIDIDRIASEYISILSKIDKRSYVGIEIGGNVIQFIAIYVACLRRELVPVLLYDRDFKNAPKIAHHITAYIRWNSGIYELFHLNAKALLPSSSDEVLLVTKTSGTTGSSKYVAWHKTGVDYQNFATSELMNYSKSDIVLNMLPPWSSYGLSMIHLWLSSNIKLAILPISLLSKNFDFFSKYKITHVETVPRIYIFIMDIMKKKPSLIKNFDSIRCFGCGGDVLPSKFLNKWTDMTDSVLYNGYGLTEAGPNVALSSPYAYKAGSIGKVLQGTHIEIADDSEIIVRSPSIMFSNWDFEPKKHELELKLFTGDLGTIDSNGFLFLKGRKKNIAIINGINICVEEIEKIILDHELVQNAAIVDIHLGYKTKLLLYYVAVDRLKKNDLMKYCKDKLLPYQIPNYILPISSLPVNFNGKIDRASLRMMGENLYNSNNLAEEK